MTRSSAPSAPAEPIAQASPVRRAAARPAAIAMEHVLCNHCGHQVTHGVHNVSRLVQCVNCGLIFVNPRPAFADLARQYEGSYFHCAEPTFGGYEDYEADHADIVRTFRGRMGMLLDQVRVERPRALDVGCATGIFLEVARDAGWQPEGVDISAYALGRAAAKGFEVHRGTLLDTELPEAGFDIITMWDLIEHVPDPAAVFAECHRLLKPGGVLAISTPDAGSVLARALRGRWLGYRSIDEHLYFFSHRTISAMLEHAGFEVRRFAQVGKVLALPRLIERMRFYSRLAALLLRQVDRLMPKLSFNVNPRDTMVVVAVRHAEPPVRREPPQDA